MKIDLHCHSYYSTDGISSPKKLLETALKKGLDGIALTDHNTIAGWKEAIEIARELNGVLILGEEIKSREGDILGLFLKKEIKSRVPIEIIKEIKEQGGIAIISHPFHFHEKFKGDLEQYKNLVDGIEVFNSRGLFLSVNKKALEFAKKYNLAIVAGSDAHYYKNVGDAYTIGENIKNLEEFKEAILKKKIKIEGKRSPLFYLIIPTLARLGLKEKVFK